jgi:hypothetical protein
VNAASEAENEEDVENSEEEEMDTDASHSTSKKAHDEVGREEQHSSVSMYVYFTIKMTQAQ